MEGFKRGWWEWGGVEKCGFGIGGGKELEGEHRCRKRERLARV